MGTNYYLVNRCSCGEAVKDKIHLGKSSAGWSFMFRGYKKYEEDLPYGDQVTNYSEWEDLITQSTWEVEDEYMRGIDSLEFIEYAKNMQGKHHAESTEGRYAPASFDHNKMVDGRSFTFAEFC